MKSRLRAHIVTDLGPEERKRRFAALLRHYEDVDCPDDADFAIIDLNYLPEQEAARDRVIAICDAHEGWVFLSRFNYEQVAAFPRAGAAEVAWSIDSVPQTGLDPLADTRTTAANQPVQGGLDAEELGGWLVEYFRRTTGRSFPIHRNCDELLGAMRWWESQFGSAPLRMSAEARKRWNKRIADLAINALRTTDVFPGQQPGAGRDGSPTV